MKLTLSIICENPKKGGTNVCDVEAVAVPQPGNQIFKEWEVGEGGSLIIWYKVLTVIHAFDTDEGGNIKQVVTIYVEEYKYL